MLSNGLRAELAAANVAQLQRMGARSMVTSGIKFLILTNPPPASSIASMLCLPATTEGERHLGAITLEGADATHLETWLCMAVSELRKLPAVAQVCPPEAFAATRGRLGGPVPGSTAVRPRLGMLAARPRHHTTH